MRIQGGSLICIHYDTPNRTHKKHKMYRLVNRVVRIGNSWYMFINEFEVIIKHKNTWTYQKTKGGSSVIFPVKSVEGVLPNPAPISHLSHL